MAKKETHDAVLDALAQVTERADQKRQLDQALVFAPDSLSTVSLELDETIRDAEDFLQRLGHGVEAMVPLKPIGDDEPEEDSHLRFSRGKDGWKLTYVVAKDPLGTDYEHLPLIEVSRQRKRFALAQFGSLVEAIKEEAATFVAQLRAVIIHAKSVMDQERSK
jgi:hypothetical protein